MAAPPVLDLDDAYRRYGPMVFRRCVQLLRDEEKAADCLQLAAIHYWTPKWRSELLLGNGASLLESTSGSPPPPSATLNVGLTNTVLIGGSWRTGLHLGYARGSTPVPVLDDAADALVWQHFASDSATVEWNNAFHLSRHWALGVAASATWIEPVVAGASWVEFGGSASVDWTVVDWLSVKPALAGEYYRHPPSTFQIGPDWLIAPSLEARVRF